MKNASHRTIRIDPVFKNTWVHCLNKKIKRHRKVTSNWEIIERDIGNGSFFFRKEENLL